MPELSAANEARIAAMEVEPGDILLLTPPEEFEDAAVRELGKRIGGHFEDMGVPVKLLVLPFGAQLNHIDGIKAQDLLIHLEQLSDALMTEVEREETFEYVPAPAD